MVISHEHKFIFVHNYKVAGNSIRAALTPVAHMSFRESSVRDKLKFVLGQYPRVFSRNFRRHTRGYLLREQLPPGMFDQYYTFGFVRNPWDWQVSLYSYMLSNPKHKQHDLITSMRSFDEYVEWRVSDDLHLQKEFFYDENGRGDCIVDFVGRFEQIREDFQSVMRHLGLDVKLPHTNRSPHKPYTEYYTQRTADLIFDAFRPDCQTFGYDRLTVAS
jgi:hypothetical protein